MISAVWRFRISYGIRLALAGVAALYVAMWLQLDLPRWAILTALMVSPPVRGDVLRKTTARVLGTPVGCAAAVILAGLFPQDRFGYLLGLGTWVGVCGFWATYRHGYVAYFAILAGFTAVIVGAATANHPELIFDTALDRGCATMVGVLCAALASVFTSHSDDVPAELVDRICMVTVRLLDWAIACTTAGNNQTAIDLPLAKPIIDLDVAVLNAIAERPVLGRYRQWLAGVPTALLSMHVSILEALREPGGNQVLASLELTQLRDLLNAKSSVDLQRLHAIHIDLASWRNTAAPLGQTIIDCELFVLSAIKATLTLQSPATPNFFFPRPSFNVFRTRAVYNLLRPVVNFMLVFTIWDATAWASGSTLLTYAGVFSIATLPYEDPVTPLKGAFLGALFGIIVGLISLYLLFPLADSFAWLAVVMGTLVAIFGIAQTIPALAGAALGFVNLILVVTAPVNPQRYDLSGSLNSSIAALLGVAIAAISFELFGAPRRGLDRVNQGIKLMRHQLVRAQEIGNQSDLPQRLRWETRLCDELTRIQAASKSPAHRQAAVELVLQNRAALQQAPVATHGSRQPFLKMEIFHVPDAAP